MNADILKLFLSTDLISATPTRYNSRGKVTITGNTFHKTNTEAYEYDEQENVLTSSKFLEQQFQSKKQSKTKII